MADLAIAYSRNAAQDLDDIWDYTARIWSPAQAETYLTGIRQSVQTLAGMPDIGRLRPEISPPVRTHPNAKHLIIYRVEGATLVVLRILHTRRNWQTLLSN